MANGVQMSFEKRLITELHIKGGLNSPDKFQKVQLWFYEKTEGLVEKIVLKFGIAGADNEFIEHPTSLRFDSIAPITDLIIALEKCKVELGKKQGDINPENFGLRLDSELDIIEKVWGSER